MALIYTDRSRYLAGLLALGLVSCGAEYTTKRVVRKKDPLHIQISPFGPEISTGLFAEDGTVCEVSRRTGSLIEVGNPVTCVWYRPSPEEAQQ